MIGPCAQKHFPYPSRPSSKFIQLFDIRKKNIDVRALCIINPGNPTGQTLSFDAMKSIIEFCKKENVVLMADEVYQANIYTHDLPFHSFKKVLKSMGKAYDDVELISFHSVSKGTIGECGRRGLSIPLTIRWLF
jgi:aspartate/methionine/tyrosine aminotransferase